MPRAVYKDPFRGGDNIIVMCDAYEPPRVLPDGTVSALKPIPTNTRAAAADVRLHLRPVHGARAAQLCLSQSHMQACASKRTCSAPPSFPSPHPDHSHPTPPHKHAGDGEVQG